MNVYITVPGCCCHMPLLYNYLMDSCKYVHKNTLLAAKGGAFAPRTPLTPLESTTVHSMFLIPFIPSPLFLLASVEMWKGRNCPVLLDK